MLTYFLWALLALAIVLVVLLVTASMRPDQFSVSRSLDIRASADRIFPMIDNVETMNTWNPFAQMQPGLVCHYSGPANGAGASYTWNGNSRAGAGRLEVTGSQPNSAIDMMLHMSRPFECHNKITFTLQPEGDLTRVTWTMSGPANMISKVMGMFCSMDKMVGGEFEKGLLALKAKAEGQVAFAGVEK